MVASTLSLLQVWYSEPSIGNERPKLLSKFAVLEFCGWLEYWMDGFIIDLSKNCLNDDDWTNSVVIQKTFGFDYGMHLRPMISKVLGEHMTRVAEGRLESEAPGDLDQIKSILGSLWKIRCQFAHADIASNITQQITFNAPSWTINQHRILNKKFEKMKEIYVQVAAESPKN